VGILLGILGKSFLLGLGGLGLFLFSLLLLPLLLLALATLKTLTTLVTLLLASLAAQQIITTPTTTTIAPPITTPPPANVEFFGDPNFIGSPIGTAQLPFGECVPIPAGFTFSSIRTGGACLALYQSPDCAAGGGYFLVNGDVPDLGAFTGATQSIMVITCP
jgi:hypothetical protein